MTDSDSSARRDRRAFTFLGLLAALTFGVAGCGDDGEETTGSGGNGGGGSEGCDGGAANTYCGDVQAILAAKCSGGVCHNGSTAGTCAGGHCSADFYSDTQKDSAVCPGEQVFNCMETRILNGQMPQGAGCTGDPAQDSGNAACLTQAEQDTISAWVAAGAPEM